MVSRGLVEIGWVKRGGDLAEMFPKGVGFALGGFVSRKIQCCIVQPDVAFEFFLLSVGLALCGTLLLLNGARSRVAVIGNKAAK